MSHYSRWRGMDPSQPSQDGRNLWLRRALLIPLCAGLLLFLVTLHKPLHANQTGSTDENAPVLKGKEPVQIIGTVVAMTREPWMGLHWSIHILLVQVDNVLDGEKTEPYVRADFLNHSIYDNSEESLAYDRFVKAFHEKGRWKIQLRPPHGIPECWRVPPPPKPEDLMTHGNPDIRAVAGATGYPNVNSVPCYAATPTDVQEIR
jgi:hypothetical protein